MEPAAEELLLTSFSLGGTSASLLVENQNENENETVSACRNWFPSNTIQSCQALISDSIYDFLVY